MRQKKNSYSDLMFGPSATPGRALALHSAVAGCWRPAWVVVAFGFGGVAAIAAGPFIFAGTSGTAAGGPSARSSSTALINGRPAAVFGSTRATPAAVAARVVSGES